MTITHMKKSLGGELPWFSKVDDVLMHAFRSMLTLKGNINTHETQRWLISFLVYFLFLAFNAIISR